MDLTTIVPVLLSACAALGLIGNYLRGQARKDRAENRKLRAMVLDGDEWMFRARRTAARRGFALDPLPKSWEALHDADEDPAQGVVEDPSGARQTEPGTGGGSRHALHEGG